MNSLSRYLSEVRKIRSLGSVPETSYYPALAELFETIGKGLAPKVRCITHPKNLGAGIPDLALFSADQIPENGEPRPGVKPSRGVVEAKGTAADIDKIAATPQTAKYLEAYGQVLVTNLREFLLVTPDGPKERFILADTEEKFWKNADDSRHADFADFLRRALLSNAPLTDPKDVAWLLASYARDARARIIGNELDALQQLRAALEESLGIAFTGEKGDAFFRSTLVQTLFYGIFSAWVLWHQRQRPTPNTQHQTLTFDWRSASYELRVPMIKALFYQAADPNRLEPLGLVEILDWAADALNRVDREIFFAKFAAENAVQYFYEPFLEAFDPELRKELGVWYTPREIVRYQVERVDAVLRSELGVAAGLADPDVVVLDPCCGTGAYLVEVLRLIHDRLTEGGADALALADVKKAAISRVFGFEILPAPFVVAHLQLGLLLQTMGTALSAATNERVGVYLTNALTGWEGEPPEKASLFPELSAERDAAGKVKRGAKILVILGNPPYNGYAGLAVEEERGLSDAYRTVKNVPKPQGQGLNDLYVRFFRMAERRIVNGETGRGGTGRGVISFISNYSWLSGLSFTGMRERYAEVFTKIWVDNLHGDRIISEYAPDGRTSDTIFAVQGTSAGIKVGTAIATMVRSNSHEGTATILYRGFTEARAEERRAALTQSLQEGDAGYITLQPVPVIGLPFKPKEVSESYLSWPRLPELFPTSFPGIKTSRDDVVVDIDLERLKAKVVIKLPVIAPTLTYSSEAIIRYAFRPLDLRWLYWSKDGGLLDRAREEYVSHIFKGNLALVSQQIPRREWSMPQVIQAAACIDLMDRSASVFPLKLKAGDGLFAAQAENPDGTNWNLSPAARQYLTTFNPPPQLESGPPHPQLMGGRGSQTAPPPANLPQAQETQKNPLPPAGEGGEPKRTGWGLGGLGRLEGFGGLDPESLFFHALAVLHSPAYRAENGGALQQDWPRIPLPATADALNASAQWGKQVAALLDTETPVPGVTAPPYRDDLKTIALLTHADRPGLQDGDLAVTAGWGNATKTGVMPGRGKIETNPDGSLDLSLNEKVAWRNIPADVYRFTIGGYQVIKKWLSYREQSVLRRPLTLEEAREVQQIARRIAALLSLTDALNANYETIKSEAYTPPANPSTPPKPAEANPF